MGDEQRVLEHDQPWLTEEGLIFTNSSFICLFYYIIRGCHGCDRMVVGYLHKVCQWLATLEWFSLGIPVSSISKTDRHDKTEILLKVALNTINLTLNLAS